MFNDDIGSLTLPIERVLLNPVEAAAYQKEFAAVEEFGAEVDFVGAEVPVDGQGVGGGAFELERAPGLVVGSGDGDGG